MGMACPPSLAQVVDAQARGRLTEQVELVVMHVEVAPHILDAGEHSIPVTLGAEAIRDEPWREEATSRQALEFCDAVPDLWQHVRQPLEFRVAGQHAWEAPDTLAAEPIERVGLDAMPREKREHVSGRPVEQRPLHLAVVVVAPPDRPHGGPSRRLVRADALVEVDGVILGRDPRTHRVGLQILGAEASPHARHAPLPADQIAHVGVLLGRPVRHPLIGLEAYKPAIEEGAVDLVDVEVRDLVFPPGVAEHLRVGQTLLAEPEQQRRRVLAAREGRDVDHAEATSSVGSGPLSSRNTAAVEITSQGVSLPRPALRLTITMPCFVLSAATRSISRASASSAASDSVLRSLIWAQMPEDSQSTSSPALAQCLEP